MSGEAERVMTEADTCREFVTPRLVESGWSVEVIGHLVYDLDTDGKKLQVVRYTAGYDGIRAANAALLPATLERIFQQAH